MYLQRLANAAGDLILAGLFLAIWIAPQTTGPFSPGEVHNILFLELAVVFFAAVLLLMLGDMGGKTRFDRAIMWAITAFLLIMIAIGGIGFAVSRGLDTGNWWIALALAAMAYDRLRVFRHLWRVRGALPRAWEIRLAVEWGLRFPAILVAGLFATVIPWPLLGMAGLSPVSAIDGTSVAQTHGYMVFGCIYFSLCALVRGVVSPLASTSAPPSPGGTDTPGLA